MSRDKKPETVQLSIRIPLTVRQELEQIAEEEQRSLNNLLNIIIMDYLRNHGFAKIND